MACHIPFFLRYLDSLEDFRKNPQVKFLPKSPCANFQCLGTRCKRGALGDLD
jgi:hypothetical protein